MDKHSERSLRTIACAVVAALVSSAVVCGEARAVEVYETPAAFVAQTFPSAKPLAKAVWLTGDLERRVERVLGHAYRDLRVRYWVHGDRRAFVLEEIGKVEPITLGVVVDGGAIESIRVLTYRESRGWEIRFPFFTDQYRGARVDPDTRLDREVDGISGATLSVRATTKVARLALVLDQAVDQGGGTTQSKAP